MRELAGARALPAAAEPVDHPLRMARSLLAGSAVSGIANAVDSEHCGVVTTDQARRPAADLTIAPLALATIWPSPGVLGWSAICP